MRLREFFQNHYRPRKLHGKSEDTLRIYSVCFNNFERTLGREAELDDLNHDTVMRHMQRMLDLGRSKATANRERVCLVALWRYASQTKKLDTWPDIPKEKEPFRSPMAWMQEEVSRLLATTMLLDGEMRGTDIPNWLWWRTLIMVILDTGERIGAVREARWEWISGDWINIPAEYRKHGLSDMKASLSPATVKLLTQLRAKSHDSRVFPWNYSETYLWNRYRKLLEKAGLPTGRKCALHRLRKTTASVAHAAGLDAQKILGHSSARITARYIDVRFSPATKPSDVLAAWLRNPPPTEHRKQA